MSKNKKNIQLKLNAWGHAYNDAFHFIIPLLLPFFRQEFSFTFFQSGIILTLHEALRSIFSLIFGSLADHYDHKHLIISAGFIFSSILLGSVVWLTNLPFMITVLLFMAIGVATFHPLATAMVGEKAKPGKQGRDLSLFSAAGTLGLTIISLLFGWLVQIWGWRITCFIISLPGFILGLGYIKIKNDHTNQVKLKEGKMTHRNLFLVYFLSRGILCLGTKPILSFFPIYATTYIGLKTGSSAWIISIYFAGVLTGSLLISNILDSRNPLQFAIVSTITTSVLIYILTYSKIPLIMWILVACIGLMEGIYFPSQNTWLTQAVSNQTRGRLFGLGFFIEGFSATVAPSIYGWLADQYGLLYAYRMASIPIFISFLLYLILYQMAKTHQNKDFNSVKLKKMDYFKEAS